MSPAIKREEGAIDAATAGTSTSSIAQFYHQLTGETLLPSRSRGTKRDPGDESKVREGSDDDDDEDNNDDDTINDEPCDLRLLTPATCLREIYHPGDYSTHVSTASMVPYLGGAALPSLAETLIRSSASGMPTGAATIPALRNIRQSGSVAGPSTSGGGVASGSGGSSTGSGVAFGTAGTSNQTTPGGAYSCSRCGNSYARPHSLNRHIRFECGVEPKFECPVCHKKSKHKHNLVLHMRTHQQR